MNQLSPTSVAAGATGPPLSPVTPVPQALDVLRARGGRTGNSRGVGMV